MSAPLPTMTQGTTSSGKKRRLEDVQNDGQGTNNDDDRRGSDSDSDGGSDGELTHQDKLERKRKRKAEQKKLGEIRHRDEGIGKVAAAYLIPKAVTPLARAIHEFTRLVMGIPRKGLSTAVAEGACQKLPDPPSEEEMEAWLNRQQRRETLIREAQEKAMEKYVKKKPQGFKPNRKQREMIEKDAAESAAQKNPMRPVIFKSRMSASGRSRYAHHFGTQCEAALAIAGFPRCTFDWNASYDTPWNSATAAIILAQWVKTYDAHGARGFGILSSDNNAADREEVLRRWCSNKAPKFREQSRQVELMKTDGGKQKMMEQAAQLQQRANKKRSKEKIYELRVEEATLHFGEGSAEVEMISHPEIHSEDELITDTSNTFGTRQKLRLEWRSSELDTFISLLDQCHWQKQINPKVKRTAKQTVERGAYAPNAEPDQFPPKGFQQSLVSQNWLDLQDGLVISELGLNENATVDIKSAIQEILQTRVRQVDILEARLRQATGMQS
ncbi:uncharacterized protein MELLADRAFT_87569 [Melampsora larici-populina 98AG31]|uniref:Uncharacterized protein n=1 Tax=Melampsora larici-populina (strain 98AG31 / pathotype 3-4-7) TaxID=747676 RepID=F4SDW3_MELLP|nr:uncharacterized protein MELLADRAFT_87569 [Melampsora larici-populina 98AG31]EGF97164.1 hypothetical protein MELLADRAFT_87569 [Melampsora larici-populina 98AG31]